MGSPRAIQLLKVLAPDELHEVKEEIAAQNRESLERLFGFLLVRKEEEDPGKEAMFRATFGRLWSKEEDYLLRNELRLLTERLYHLITRRENDEEQKNHPRRSDPLLLRGLLKRRAFRLFDSLYKKLREEARNRHDYRTAHRLNEVRFEYLIHYCEIDPQVMKEAHAVLMENLDNLKRAFRNEIAENQHRRIVCEQNLLAMGLNVSTTQIGPDADLRNHDTPFALYYDATSRAHAAQGEERIAHALEALACIEPVKHIFPERLAFGYAITGSAFFAERRYIEATEQFEAGIHFAREQNFLPPLELLFNYASTLMRLRRYADVLNLLDEYHQEFRSRPKLLFRLECFRCFCHIFMREPAKALQAIPPDIHQRPESEYHYFRFIYLILPYLRNDPETALREARNFLVYFNRRREQLLFAKEKRIAALFRRFYAAVYNEPDAGRRRRQLQVVINGVEDFLKDAPEYRDYLYIRWLVEEVEEAKG